MGIAGLVFSKTLRDHGKSFVVIDSTKKGATKASGGVLNPTVLKRFTPAWNTVEFVLKAATFYESLARDIGQQVLSEVAIHRILASVEEQNNWMVASDKEILSRFLSPKIVKNNNTAISAPFGLGAVTQAKIMKPYATLKTYHDFLKKQDQFIEAQFDYQELIITKTAVQYKDIKATKIVFAEGSGVVHNPYFTIDISPKGEKVFVGNKGEYIIIKAPELQSEAILKGPVMVIPLGDDLYKVGASYGRDDYSTNATLGACEEISAKLSKMISCDFSVVDQVTGIRPTVKDRKPLVGSLQNTKSVSFLNGLGTRGLTMAPSLAGHLYDYLENDVQIPELIDIKRFAL
jgi:glycine/D-amino acid oxidase-like deaminating enzyme